jgi:hypothetical protein
MLSECSLLVRLGYRARCSFGVRSRYGGPSSHDALFRGQGPRWGEILLRRRTRPSRWPRPDDSNGGISRGKYIGEAIDPRAFDTVQHESRRHPARPRVNFLLKPSGHLRRWHRFNGAQQGRPQPAPAGARRVTFPFSLWHGRPWGAATAVAK